MQHLPTKRQSAIDLAEKLRLIRPRDFEAHNLPRAYLFRLSQEGILQHLSRGLYQYADEALDANQSLAEAGKLVPQGVICLLSALRFHDLTTQMPHQVWMTIGPKARAPKIASPRLHIVRASGKSLTEGVEQHRIEGVDVRIYSAAKTVVDCFKYRRLVGMEAAIEALRDCRHKRCASMDDIWRFAEICRVTNVMRPYLEAL
ncbi:MAG: type IV toxin-antitoxin system AbiEi family antitoxin domain-containing protein [Methyloceanibacter sp.]